MFISTFKLNVFQNKKLRAGVVHRFRRGKPEDIGIPFLLFKFISHRLLKQASGQGYGLHTMDESSILIQRKKKA
jgi:hypothetical protein